MSGETEKKYKHVSYVSIFSFISRSHIKMFLFIILFMYLGILVMALITSHLTLGMVNDIKKQRFDNIISKITEQPKILCYAIDCLAYKPSNTDTWYNVDGRPFRNDFITELKNNTVNTVYERYTLLETNKATFILSEIDFLVTIISASKLTLIALAPLIIIVYIVFVYYNEKTKQYEFLSRRQSMENRLQRNLSESLYHEMVQPLALIRDITTDVATSIKNNCSGDNADSNGCCPLDRSIVTAIEEYTPTLMDAIERMQATLDQVAAVKRIKYSNGTTSLYKIINNSILSTNTTSVNKLSAKFENLSILNKYSVGGTLNNGDMLNILNILNNNALEAGATKIVYSAVLELPYIKIRVSDNGVGIRDKNGNVVKDLDIFNYGHSTKGGGKNGIVNTMLNKVGMNITTHKTVRGAGLSLNKELLQSHNGDIVVLETSASGTVFEIKIPTKKTENV